MLAGAHTKKYIFLAGAALIIVLFHLGYTYNTPPSSGLLDVDLSSETADLVEKKKHPESAATEVSHPKGKKPEHTPSKHAYVIFLSDDLVPEGQTNINDDLYFVGTRILLYQLIHAPETRTKKYDVVVVVTPSVREEKRKRMRDDGAIVTEVEPLDIGWVTAGEHRWDSVMQKFRIWQMTQYERILIMDSDEVLQTNIDAVFEDPKAVILKPKPQPEGFKQLEHEAPFPEEYLMAGMEELANTHKFPTQGPEDYYQGGGYLNAGFMLVKPSQDVFEYYVSLTKVNSKKADGTWLFNPVFPEQALLNYAHRMDGPMPWIPLDPLWMLHLATAEDVKKTKPKGIHTKWWTQPEMKIWLETWKWRMDAFWQGREEESDDR